MTAPNMPDIGQIEGGERAAEAAHTKTLAQSIAAAVANSADAAGSAPDVDDALEQDITQDGLTELEQSAIGEEYELEPDDVPAKGADEIEGTETIEEIVEEMSPEQLSKLEASLVEAGLNIAVKAADLPAEAQGPYIDAMEQIQAIVLDLQDRETSTREQQLAMEEFANKLQNEPDKILIAMALTHPEHFESVHDVMQQAADDPRMKELLVRELQTEARLAEINRRDRAFDERDQLSKARTVIVATKRAAQKYDVPFELADKVVARIVQANDNDLDPAAVDAIVADLKGAGRSPTARRVRRVVSKQELQAARKQQQTSTPASPQGDVPTDRLSPGLEEGERKGSGGLFRGLVRDASRKVAGRARR